jgi:cysteine synthase A
MFNRSSLRRALGNRDASYYLSMTANSRPSALAAIGDTPMIELRQVPVPGGARVFLKLESANPTGSYKDRKALAMIEQAEQRGSLRPGMRVIEYTGGSTGSSLAMVCAVKGYKFIAVSSDAFSKEKLQAMRAFGAEVIVVPSEGGRITPALFDRMKAEIARLAAEPGSYWADQFHNADSFAGYAELGREILAQVPRVDVFTAAVGTGAMFAGVLRVLKKELPQVRAVALEPASSAILSGGDKGAHRIEGIGVGFVPPLLFDSEGHGVYDEVMAIEETEARTMARHLAREEGVFAGTSTGVNVAAAVQLASRMRAGQTVVTVAVDSGYKYLAGDLYSQE